VPSVESRSESRPPAPQPPALDFAAQLRQARERRGISLRQIAATTKISLMVLEALERGDMSRLPGGIFTRAFLRAYAREVGLDPEHTVREFIARYPAEAPGDEPTTPTRERDESPFEEAPSWWAGALRLLWMIVPVALAIVYFAFGARLWRSGVPESASPPAAPSVQVPAGSPHRDQAPAPPATGAGAGQESVRPPEPATPPLAEPTEARPAAGDRAEARLVVRLAPTEECWVWLRVDGGEAEQQLMRAGEAREIRARDEIVMTLGNAGAMHYSVNGQPGRVLGEIGAVVNNLRITPQNVRTFQSVPQR